MNRLHSGGFGLKEIASEASRVRSVEGKGEDAFIQNNAKSRAGYFA